MEVLSQYTVPVVLGICLAIGWIIKHWADFIPNKLIPMILGVFGMLINIWLQNWMLTPEILLGGLASGWAATGAHQSVTQLTASVENNSEQDNR
jgi:uncharacterized membrane protein